MRKGRGGGGGGGGKKTLLITKGWVQHCRHYTWLTVKVVPIA